MKNFYNILSIFKLLVCKDSAEIKVCVFRRDTLRAFLQGKCFFFLNLNEIIVINAFHSLGVSHINQPEFSVRSHLLDVMREQIPEPKQLFRLQ